MFDPERVKLVYDKLIQIPHLNITNYVKPAPMREILKEYLQFEDADFYPYISGLDNEEIKTHMANNWKGMCIIDTTVSGKHNVDYMVTENNFDKLEFKFDDQGNALFSPTDVGELVPNTIRYLYEIVKYPKKTRISRMVANGGNPSWHSHRLLANGGDQRFTSHDMITPVLHIPLITNNRCFMGVATRYPPKNPDIHKYWQRYNFGEVWIFNSYYYHQAVNLGPANRDHIMMYVPVDDEYMFPILEKAVAEYQGDIMPVVELR